MKPTQVTELLANIKNTFVSFFSILMFVALGVGIFLGISWAGPALQVAADGVYDQGAAHDFQVQFSYGLTDDDLAKLADVEGVSQVEAGRQSFQTLGLGDKEVTVKAQTMGESINVPVVVEGELPAKKDEIAVNAHAAKKLGISVGDTVTFKEDAESEDDGDGAGNGSESDSDGKSADDDGMQYLNGSTYKVTALVKSPEYLANSSATYGVSNTPSASVDIVAFALPEAFDGEAFQDGYPVANIRCDSLSSASAFSETYKNDAASMKARIVELGDELALARYDDLHGNAQDKLDDAKQQVEDGKEKIENGTADLDKARSDLEGAKSDLEKAKSDLSQAQSELDQAKASGYAKLADSRSKLTELEKKRDEATPKVNKLKSAIDSAESSFSSMKTETDSLISEASAVAAKHKDDPAQYAAAMAPLVKRANAVVSKARSAVPTLPDVTIENFAVVMGSLSSALSDYRNLSITENGETTTINKLQAQYKKASSDLAELSSAIDSGWSQYNEGQAELNQQVWEGEQKIADGQQKIADGEQSISDGEQKIADGEADLDKARADVADAEAKVADNQEKVDQMKKYDWSVSARYESAGAVEVETFSGVTNRLSFSMAALFVIVGLLVSYSAVSRIVHEQITQIGTKKALGLREREITLSFLAYSALAVVTGAIVGTIVGVTLVEGIIGRVLGGMFIMGSYPPYFGAALFAIVTALELVLVLGATWLACHSILREHAVELLKGEKPPEGKTRFYEKWGVWERLPLFTQTIVNNCMNDKRRVFSTIVGVAGCTALIVTAITLNDDVLKSYDRHYEDVFGFNLITFVDADVENADDRIEAAAEDAGSTAAQVLRKSLVMTQPNGDRGSMRLIVPESPEKFAQVYHVNPVEGLAFDPAADGAWVSQAYGSKTGAKVGDKVAVESGDGVVHEIPIMGFYEFWLTNHEMVMGRDFYEREFDTDLATNVVLIDSDGASVDDVESALSGVDGFYSITDDKASQHQNFAEFSNVSSAVVAIYLALAALMAVVVLLNLNVMFIDEKKRELIVLMINGFSVKDAKRYIYNDTIVLTALGIVCGVVLGCASGAMSVGSVEPSTAQFVKDVDPIAVAAGVAGSAILAFIMSAISLRRIPRFELTDINKF